MSMKNIKQAISAILRIKAEKTLRFKSLPSASISFRKIPVSPHSTDRNTANASEEELKKPAFELGVHQMEPEMQNPELLLAKEQAESAVEKYTELFDFAPSGSFTLSTKGTFLELNHVGEQILGKERSVLRNGQFYWENANISPVLNSKNEINHFCKDIISVRSGIEACRNNRDIDLVLMDIKTPETNSAEEVRQIRHFNPKADVIAQTAYALSNNKAELINAGCNNYISNPFSKRINCYY